MMSNAGPASRAFTLSLSFQIKEKNWRVVSVIYEDDGVFRFDESQFTAAVEDLGASMKKTLKNKSDCKTVKGEKMLNGSKIRSFSIVHN